MASKDPLFDDLEPLTDDPEPLSDEFEPLGELDSPSVDRESQAEPLEEPLDLDGVDFEDSPLDDLALEDKLRFILNKNIHTIINHYTISIHNSNSISYNITVCTI